MHIALRILVHTVIRLVAVAMIGVASVAVAELLNPHDDDGLGTGLTFFLLVALAIGGWALADGAIMGWHGLVPWLVVTAAAPLLLGWDDPSGLDPFFFTLVGAPALAGAGFGAAVHHALEWSNRRAATTAAPRQA